MIIRPRRLRLTQALRDMVRETRLASEMLIYPVFIKEGVNIIEDVPAMPGQKRWSPDRVSELLESVAKLKIGGVLFFGVPEHKDAEGSGAWDDNGAVQQAMRITKKNFPDLTIIGDVCLCEYTSHGHCGVLKGNTVDNDPTLKLLAKTAVSQARAGADIIAPSDMMDGRVGAIRDELDKAGLENTLIFSYAVKYASAFYGPFREADPRNVREAIKEAQLDVQEGADMIMVKPGLPYLDVLRAVKERVNVPVGSYCVSGEYSMIKAAAQNGWLDEERVVGESAVCLARAGADMIVTYFAPELAKWIHEGKI